MNEHEERHQEGPESFRGKNPILACEKPANNFQPLGSRYSGVLEKRPRWGKRDPAGTKGTASPDGEAGTSAFGLI